MEQTNYGEKSGDTGSSAGKGVGYYAGSVGISITKQGEKKKENKDTGEQYVYGVLWGIGTGILR